MEVLSRPKPNTVDDSFTVAEVGAAAYNLLAKNSKKDGTKMFALSIEEINAQISFDQECQADALDLNSIDTFQENINDIKSKLPDLLHEFADVFDRSKANDLPPHRPYDHKIDLQPDAAPPKVKFTECHPTRT